jgi:hypothetical protein
LTSSIFPYTQTTYYILSHFLVLIFLFSFEYGRKKDNAIKSKNK